MFIEIRCSGCNAKLRIPRSDQGKRGRCPKCGQTLNPATASADTASPAEKPPLSTGPAALTQHAPNDPKPGLAAPEPDLLDSEVNIPQGPTRVDLAQASAAHALERDAEKSAATRSSPGAGDAGIGSRQTASDKDGGDEALISLPGYQLLNELGRGGMGKVFLARQKSLDRLVALKVMHPRRAKDPTFVARFTREAYAAAQLVHHHIVQIYDIGAEQGVHFFTMEYVKGETLTDLVRREGKLDPELAAGYILQAARGLKFGHDLGMVHRDVKPDNLLVNDQGIVKVADLGLVKLPYVEEVASAGAADDEHSRSTEVTRVGAGVGTPIYMAPEQARDATHVDARADIYSLGCTLYVLLTGKPPFHGKTAAEILTKHATVPFVPPESFVKRVPKGLSAVVSKMLAKKPQDRFADMDGVIAALEKYLGIQPAGTFSPREEHAQLLERCVKAFNEAPHARLRSLIMSGFLGGCVALLLMFLLMRWLAPAGALLGLAVLTPLAYFLVHGWRERTFLFLMVREWVLGIGLVELLYAVAATLFLIFMLYLFDLLWIWMIVAVLAAGLAVAFYWLVDRRLAVQRGAALDRVEKLLRNMRLHGLDERSLGAFICKYSGRDWEEFFEHLFGYPAKLKARAWLRGEAAQRRRRHGAWRDSIIFWIDARQKARKKTRERVQLQAIEAKALEARGINEAEAKQKAAQVADVMVAQAAQVEEDMAAFAAAGQTAVIPVAQVVPVAELAPPPPAPPPASPANFQKLLETALNPDTSTTFELPPRRVRFSAKDFAAALVGARIRFMVGAVLCFCCIFWIRQNQFLEGDGLSQAFTAMIEQGSTEKWDHLGLPLAIPLAPAAVQDLFNSMNVGIAGLLLLISAFLGGWKASLIAWPAGASIFLGSTLLPAARPLSGGAVGLLTGLLLAIVGLLIRRSLRRSAAPANAETPPEAAQS